MPSTGRTISIGPDVASGSEEYEGGLDDEEGGERDEVRFTLTAEAGLNDGLAFPFVHLAIQQC